MRVAIVHDWLTGMRGGEKVLEVFCELYPDADIFTLVAVPDNISDTIKGHTIVTSFINRLPWAWRRHQLYLPLFPTAVESFDLSDYDFVISSSHCVAKGAVTRPRTAHVCYCYTPMRYAWDFHATYRAAARPAFIAGPIFSLTLSYLRMWDVASCRRPNSYIAISNTVRRRVERYYGLPADVVYPPVDTEFFTPSGEAPGEYWLLLSAMVPYKRLDVAIEAFNRSGRALHVVGDGAERRRLEDLAGPNVTFLGWLPSEGVRKELQGCAGLIFPGEEDFGITPLEANACGRPVVALSRGGVTESQVEGETAVFFGEQSPEAINVAIEKTLASTFDPKALHAHAETFSRSRFRREMSEAFSRALDEQKARS